MIDKKVLRDWLTEHSIDEVEAVVPDMAGIARGKFIPAAQFALHGGMRLPQSVFIQTVTGEYADEPYIGSVDHDMEALPDLATLRTVPWANEPTACAIHDCYFADGSLVDIAPRQLLRRVIGLYQDMSLVPVVAPEVEFYFVKRNNDPDYPLEPPAGRSGRQETVRQPFSMDAIDEFEAVIEEIYDCCEVQKLMVDNLVHEGGTAQLEINFAHGDPLELADQVFMFKRMVRGTALRHNIHATFMAKPMEHEPGSSMHWHVSLRDAATGTNAFTMESGDESPLFKHFIGGLQHYLADAIMLLAPYVNSYRRFTRYQSAPINLQWGYDNRTVGLRVPQCDPSNRRIENRLAGADVNPYLAAAATLACGYLGIKQKLAPGRPEAGNAYKRPLELPKNLYDGLSRLQASEPLKEILGERFINVYSAIKQEEYDAYFQVISPWEREHLLLSV